MTLDERRLAVGILLTLIVLVRLVAHHEAGGLTRDQSDGLDREGGRAQGVLLRVLFLGGGLGGALLWVLAPGLLPTPLDLPRWAPWLGLSLAQLGLGLLVWVHIALGVHFSGTLHLRGDHTLVQRGPYARVRHPMYTAFLLLLGGLALLMGDGLLAAVLLGSQVWVIGQRLPLEERSLAERFPEAWPAHAARTGVLLPRRWED